MSSVIKPKKQLAVLLPAILLAGIVSNTAQALVIEPGVGVGVEYTDNAKLDEVNEQSDTIVNTYVGANISHDQGALKSNLSAAFNKHNYLQDSFDDQRYLKLIANADWAMLDNSLIWSLKDQFFQRPVVSTGNLTPNNIQDTNVFSLNAQWHVPVPGISRLTLIPEYKKFYYEVQSTDNQQYGLTASWQYPYFRLTGLGLTASVRTVDYEQPLIADTTFTSFYFNSTGKRARSDFEINLGATNVNREGDQSHTGFAGDVLWLLDISSVSKIRTVLSTELTDASNGGVNTRTDPTTGELVNIQVTTDVIRNKLFSFSYLREDGVLKSRVWTDFREVLYSDSPNDRKIGIVGIELDYPLSEHLTSGFYTRYNKTRLTQQLRTDEITTVGLHFKYQHARKLKSTIDIRHQEKDSTAAGRSYSNASIYYEMVYGFGSVYRRSRSGGS